MRALLLSVLVSVSALAQDAGTSAPAPAPVPAPSAAEAKKTIDYFLGGKGQGPVLMEFHVCLKPDSGQEGGKGFGCLEAVSGPVKKGTSVYALTSWLVPQGDKYEDISVQYLFEGVARETKDVVLAGSMRSRSSRNSTLMRAGKWTVQVLRGTQVLAKADVTVE